MNSEPPPLKASSEDTRQLIIEEARNQLRRFGQAKMTVVDIARALGMSHANVYRFFTSKAEILDAVIDDWLARVEAFVEGVAARPGTSAVRLEAVVIEIHQRRRAKYHEDPEIYHAFRRLMEARPDAVAKRQEKIANVFRKIIQAGVESGEFSPVDATAAATALEDATAIFLHPMIMPASLNDSTEGRARNVVQTMVRGLAAQA